MKANTIKDGFGIQITFGTGESGTDHSDITLSLDPTSITPPGGDGGDAIDTVTHSNTEFRTKFPRSLLDYSDGTFSAAYDPSAYLDIVDLVNDNVLITFIFPTGDSMAVFGYLKSFTPKELVEGQMPTADCTLVVTNYDHETGEESPPVFTAASA